MAYYQSTYHSKVYRDFKEIEINDYRKIVHFYEDHEANIRRLDEQEYFDMLTAYVDALFEIGAYQKHLLMVDLVIEAVIQRNIVIFRGEDIFRKMLFRKAASCYQTHDFDRAEYILKELLRMDTSNSDACLFLKKCLRKKEPALLQHARAVSIFLFLLTALVISIEVLLVRPFYQMHAPLVERSRITIFALGCVVLVGGNLFHRWRVDRQVSRFVEELNNR